MNQTAIGSYIARKRKGQNLTQEQLAEQLSVSNKTISKWENGKCMPAYSIIQKLCEAIHVTLPELMDGENAADSSVRVYDDAQILDLLRSLKDRINSSIMLITHDLGVIAEMADYVVVMYAGRVVEKGTVEEIFAHPSHPYTIGLMASKPVVGKKVDRLYSIPGKVPSPVDMPNYCYFKDRCELQLPCCSGEYPCEISLSPTHKVSCYRYYEENRKAGE